MFRIRFHGRGGQGLKVASRILGSAFFASGYEVQDAPRYGAERRGAPVFAYVRASRHAINERGIITDPDLVVVADDTLLPLAAAAVLQGVSARTVMLLNTAATRDAWRERLKLAGPVVAIAAGKADADDGHTAYAGAACAGAAARLVGIIGAAALERAVRQEVSAFGATAVEQTLAQALHAYDACAPHAGLVHEGAAHDARHDAPPAWIYLSAEPAQAAAPDIATPGTSARVNTGAWRVMRPVIDLSRCNRCSWICSTYCPDSAIRVDADHTPHIDYDHCKGCLVCTTVCPPHAIGAVPETGQAAQ
jgi:pyruvate ferredoxin oxidoreductase gamma subunit